MTEITNKNIAELVKLVKSVSTDKQQGRVRVTVKGFDGHAVVLEFVFTSGLDQESAVIRLSRREALLLSRAIMTAALTKDGSQSI
jgi:hypothetical protein